MQIGLMKFMHKEIPNSFQRFRSRKIQILHRKKGGSHLKNFKGVGGFAKILRNFQSGSWQMLMSNYKVGGWGEKRPKTCLHNI